jgi:hypothetical protein
VKPAKAVTVIKLDPPKDEYIWNLWYNAKHGPERFDVPGYTAFRRFVVMEGMPKDMAITGEPKYISLYDLTDIKEVYASEAYAKLMERNRAEASVESTPDNANREDRKLSRGLYNQIYLHPDKGGYEAPYVDYLLYVGHEVPKDKVDEFNDWYNNKRIPEVARFPGFVAARRLVYDDESDHLKIVRHDVTTPRYVTLYDFDSTEAFESGAFTKPGEPAGVSRVACQLYERFYPYKGFKYMPTLI